MPHPPLNAADAFFEYALSRRSNSEYKQLVDSYRRLLSQIDARFSVAQDSGELPSRCRAGCARCCSGVFEITMMDALLVAQAVDAHPEKHDIIVRARRFSDAVSQAGRAYPHFFREDAPEVARALDRLDHLPCPLLDAHNRCMIYESRPGVCRFQGMPVIDPQTGIQLPDFCPVDYRPLSPVSFDLENFDCKEVDFFENLCTLGAVIDPVEMDECEPIVAAAILACDA